jgi:hypothetical protein
MNAMNADIAGCSAVRPSNPSTTRTPAAERPRSGGQFETAVAGWSAKSGGGAKSPRAKQRKSDGELPIIVYDGGRILSVAATFVVAARWIAGEPGFSLRIGV